VVSGDFRGQPYTDGVKDGRAKDFVDENINKDHSIEVPLPAVETDLAYSNSVFPRFSWSQS
jgi:hypothetical protein